ncbi:hypothetical protein [Corynebacterium sp. HMSC077B05]|uniref:hypothetical protein n=1 Tax=Corynebacterium sp. HMSC077B05 TaxID=1739252 RepID=UPI0011D16F70|nr:hypothetical protein [Corynebacterium sp. HMSC077B05]
MSLHLPRRITLLVAAMTATASLTTTVVAPAPTAIAVEAHAYATVEAAQTSAHQEAGTSPQTDGKKSDESSDGSSEAGAVIGYVLLGLVVMDVSLSGLAYNTCYAGNPDAQCDIRSLTSSFIGSSLLGGYSLVSGLATMATDSLAASSSRLGLGAR